LAKRSKVEIIKEQSDYLRHPLMEELVNDKTFITEESVQLMKFHGSYMQDHREKRAFGQGKFYQFMMRTRQPAGLVTNRLYLVMDDLADQVCCCLVLRGLGIHVAACWLCFALHVCCPTCFSLVLWLVMFWVKSCSGLAGLSLLSASLLLPYTCDPPRVCFALTQYGNGTLRLTTRQAYQLHGVLKQDLKTVFSSVVKNMGSTLGACGDVNRNVMGPAAPYRDRPDYVEAVKVANDIADLLAPQSGAYYDMWLDGEKFMSVYKEVRAITCVCVCVCLCVRYVCVCICARA
jgi:hypothetical protein